MMQVGILASVSSGPLKESLGMVNEFTRLELSLLNIPIKTLAGIAAQFVQFAIESLNSINVILYVLEVLLLLIDS